MIATKNKLLLGIIVDVSGSMQKSWYNRITSKKSRIELIKSSLNREFNQIRNSHKETDLELHLFCVGMGFKDSVGSICDLLALSEIVPSQEKLTKLKAAIQEFWNEKAEEFISEIDTNDSAIQELETILINDLSKSKLSDDSFYWRLMRFLFRNLSPSKFEDRAKYLSSKLINDVIGAAKKVFEDNKSKYENLINDKLKAFAYEQIQLILHRNALGFKLEIILENFDKGKMLELADSIYTQIKRDISKQIRTVWINNRLTIFAQKVKVFSDVEMNVLKDLTEQAIRNIGWKSLQPFVESEAIKIFSEQFQRASKENLQNWLLIASKREVIRELRDIHSVLPESSTESIYSKEFMFGKTPMLDAMNIASVRLLERRFENYKKGLIVISDGGWSKAYTIDRVALLLKNQSVTIATGYVGKKPYLSSEKNGLRNIVSMSSDLNSVAESDLGKQVSFLKQKLSVHLNHPENLSGLIRYLTKSNS